MTTTSIDHQVRDAIVARESARPAAKVDDGPVLDHEYDGIKEYDNPLPRWWVLMFWASFVFSIGYYLYYHVLGVGESIAQGYVAEQRSARERQLAQVAGETVSEEGLSKLSLDPALMGDAKALFEQRCSACHGAQGQGLIGPNLTDGHFLHGGKLMNIYETVGTGVAAKGMPAWQAQLSPIELRKVAAFVGTLRGKNLPGKPPEGTEQSP
jgi:cytochrome c oxidase cbb3-type subunit III